MSLKQELVDGIIGAVTKIVTEGGESLEKALIENRDKNRKTENGKQKTIMTVVPKVQIELNEKGIMEMEGKLRVVHTDEDIFTCKITINPNQPELGLKDQPDENEE